MENAREPLPTASTGSASAMSLTTRLEALRSSEDLQAADPVSAITSIAEEDPAFLAELDMLSLTIDEYERMLADEEPLVITTDNTVG